MLVRHRIRLRYIPPSTHALFARNYSVQAAKRSPHKLVVFSICAVLGIATLTPHRLDTRDCDPLDALSPDALSASNEHVKNRKTSELIRAYFVFLSCSSSTLVDYAPRLLKGLESLRDDLPLGIGGGIWSFTKAFVKRTFFAQFVGGESAQQCLTTIRSIEASGAACLLNYSIEAEAPAEEIALDKMLIQSTVDETLACIKVMGREDRKPSPTMMAIKLTGFLQDPTVFERASSSLASSTSHARGENSLQLFSPSPVLSDDDVQALRNLYSSLHQICKQAEKHGVRLVFDAEQTWFQPALDLIVQSLQEEFNQTNHIRRRWTSDDGNLESPWTMIYNTYQCNLKQAPELLERDLARAKAKGYSLGVKLVRGAYMEGERRRAAKNKVASPVCENKAATDECFDSCASLLLDRLMSAKERDSVSVIFATHNTKSVKKVLSKLRDGGALAQRRDGSLRMDDNLVGRLCFAQLYAMSTALTSTLLQLLADPTNDTSPFVLLYLPYGTVDECIPYLTRRASENKSILQGDGGSESGARQEIQAVRREFFRRLFWLG